MSTDTDSTIRQIEFELEKAERGLAMPYDAERVGQLRKMLVEARKRKLSDGLAERRKHSLRAAPGNPPLERGDDTRISGQAAHAVPVLRSPGATLSQDISQCCQRIF